MAKKRSFSSDDIRTKKEDYHYTESETPLKKFREGIVYYWPKKMQDKGQPPLRGRLVRITERRRKHDVWLFTNVEDKQQLPHELAAKFYRWRWENKGFFRTYKRTLKKVKLDCQTLRTVHREAEGSMIATQLLLCLGARAMPAGSAADKPIQCSPRKVLLAIRHDLGKDQPCSDFSRRLAKARRERRDRKTEKEKRVWPRRKPHKPPAPPNLLPIDNTLKSKLEPHILAA